MTKTQVYTLIATALLGVLLFLILRLTGDLQMRVDGATETDASPGTAFIRESGLPRITTRAELLDRLRGKAIDAEDAIRKSIRWRNERGFFGPDELLGVTEENSPVRAYDALTDRDLAAMSDRDDVGATQALALRSSPVDPIAAMTLYETAASQGSIYAMLRIGSLRETFADLADEKIEADEDLMMKLGVQGLEESDNTMHVAAFAYVAAAVRDGGPAVVDHELLAWITRMAERFPPAREAEACAYSDQLFIRTGVARRGRGLPPITTNPPPVFLGIPDLDDLLPCRTTPHPIIQLLDVSECSTDRVENSRGETVDLYICRH
jgi:hypothetical protein